MSLFNWIETATALECEGLELYSGFLESHDSGYLKKIRQRIESLGMTMPMMCYSPDFTNPDALIRAKETEKQQKMIQVTAELGGRFCRTLSGQRYPEVSVQDGIDWVVSCIEGCLKTSERCGVKLVIENHYKDGYWKYPEFAQKKEVFLDILRRIDSSVFGVQYDPSNALVAGEDPVEFLAAVIQRVMTMHASDRYLLPGTSLEDMREADGTLGYPKNLCHGIVGKGLIRYDDVFSRLSRAGFTGWVSIEDGMNGLGEMKASVDFLKQMRTRYFMNM
ncbi:MAG: sugar phosphate isomerase/epimerase [Verrucomicrobia bacterium]|nr:sugar phosphate isomerase/epimerase [Verrucomicrobiota bacterium]MBU1735537.1 sugar phosphate isomerase/epimerase [Verrucomicrobiota bacterium]MBU1858004.1 sugar phosphate isomerase/epimerase [Verrucomicrobiota bacterium]